MGIHISYFNLRTVIMHVIFLFLMLMVGAKAYNETVPEWVELECENDHKYLFSDVQHNWNEARAECVLYGGWLVNQQHEGIQLSFKTWDGFRYSRYYRPPIFQILLD